jgi:hypothetical protein
VIVVNRQATLPTTTTPVPVPNSADGALAILPVEKGLIPFRRLPPATELTVPVGQSKALAAAIRAVDEPGKLLMDFLQTTPFAKHQAVTNVLVFGAMEAQLNQMGAHNPKRHSRPF